GEVLAEEPIVHAQRLLPGAAKVTRVVGDAGIDHHPLPRPHRAHPRPHRVHHAGAVGAEDVGKTVLERQPAHHEQIEVIQGRGPQRDPHHARPDGRGRHLGEPEAVEPARGVDHPGAHRNAARRYGRNAGVIICSVPVVGTGMGAPPAPPPGATGWLYTRNTFFCTATTRPSRSPAGEGTASAFIRSVPVSGTTRPVPRSAFTTCVVVRPPSLRSTR